ncbi:MAG TPA: HisA/HisF-related TIM barrel protein [Actinomycetota bacterium]|nr:HisA/HisF-related TIM barrel protein [Actinomycetota bacterium]
MAGAAVEAAVSFEVLPALDVAAGRLARPGAGGAVPIEAFGGDPVAAAEAFAAAGARWLHVVDLDLARSGEPANLGLVRRLARLPLRVQASGGIVEPVHLEAFLEAGAARVVLASAAFADQGGVARAVERFGEALVVGLEVEDGAVRPRGRGAELSLAEAVAAVRAAGAARVLVTAVGRVGGLGGPELGAVRAVAEGVGRPVLAAGGIAAVEHLRALARVPGVEGAVVGRAALDGVLDLRAALAELA